MKRFLITTAMIALVLLLVIGVQYWQRSNYSDEFQRSQAKLAFSHWNTYKRLTDYLSRGCLASAQATLDRALELQEMLMAQFVRKYQDSEFEAYVSLREPRLTSELANKEPDWGKTWTIPACDVELSSGLRQREAR